MRAIILKACLNQCELHRVVRTGTSFEFDALTQTLPLQLTAGCVPSTDMQSNVRDDVERYMRLFFSASSDDVRDTSPSGYK